MARELAPHLFLEEADPLKWIRASDFDPWAAAARSAAARMALRDFSPSEPAGGPLTKPPPSCQR